MAATMTTMRRAPVETSSDLRGFSRLRALIVVLTALIVFGGGFLTGRLTSPAYRRLLVGSFDRAMDITVGDCAPGNGDTNPARIPVEIVWRSAWRTGEFPFRVHGFTSNVHIGVSWDPARWPFAEMSVAAGGHGWSVGPNFTPSGRAGEAWAVDQARRKNLLPLQGVLPSTFMQELGPSKGLWVLENFYSNAPQGSWTATFSALHAAGPSSSNATFAMFDADGSMIEKTVDLACGA